jgi:hypothetical protein
MKEISSSETSVPTKGTRRHIQEDDILQGTFIFFVATPLAVVPKQSLVDRVDTGEY